MRISDWSSDVCSSDLAALAHLGGGEGGPDAADDGAKDFEQGPDRRDAYGARADEARLHAEGGADDLRKLRARRERRGEIGHQPDPAYQQAEEHGHAH